MSIFGMGSIFRGDKQEAILREFFRNVKFGYFVEVGAADPEINSQSWQFEQAGWSGVLVEPRPDMAEKLRRHRNAMVFEMACSSPANGGRTMPLHVAGGFSSLNENLVIAGFDAKKSIDVTIGTLDEILLEAGASAPIDFVSIDVEGHEIEVLEGFTLDRWRPRLLLVEDHVLDLNLHRFLQARGYKWVRRTDLNGWYVPANMQINVSWFGRLQFFRKYYLSLPARRVRDAARLMRKLLGLKPSRNDRRRNLARHS
jgi:FkbM family methyltransferase